MASNPARRFISASEFKARCLELMDEVNASRSELVITKHGAAVARLVPMADTAASALGFLRGTVASELSLFDSEAQLGGVLPSKERPVARVSAKTTRGRPSGNTRSK